MIRRFAGFVYREVPFAGRKGQEHGVVVEHLPWSNGRSPVTSAMIAFLATWARHRSWGETARIFRTRWEAVHCSVEWLVECGLEHRELVGVHTIGIDEIH